MKAKRKTYKVQVGGVLIGGGAPVSVQSMTNTPTQDVEATFRQARELIEAGAELVRMTVNTEEAARAIPEIKKRLNDFGLSVPLIGDFHFNGHLLLSKNPQCAKALDKYRINPGNVGRGSYKEDHFALICKIARDLGKPVRIGVNSGSLDPELITQQIKHNEKAKHPRSSQVIFNECMVLSALESTALALKAGLKKDQIVLSCKTSSPQGLVELYRKLAKKTDQPLHLGLTEAGIGSHGVVASSVACGILLNEGIGDTLRISLTPGAGVGRTEEVYVAQEILQSLGLRMFNPSVTSCPGCGRTTSAVFQEIAGDTQNYLRKKIAQWKKAYPGVEDLTIAVMGCVVNGPGESKHADIGLSLPGAGENPSAPVYVEGKKAASLKGSAREISEKFIEFIEGYVKKRFGRR